MNANHVTIITVSQAATLPNPHGNFKIYQLCDQGVLQVDGLVSLLYGEFRTGLFVSHDDFRVSGGFPGSVCRRVGSLGSTSVDVDRVHSRLFDVDDTRSPERLGIYSTACHVECTAADEPIRNSNAHDENEQGYEVPIRPRSDGSGWSIHDVSCTIRFRFIHVAEDTTMWWFRQSTEGQETARNGDRSSCLGSALSKLDLSPFLVVLPMSSVWCPRNSCPINQWTTTEQPLYESGDTNQVRIRGHEPIMVVCVIWVDGRVSWGGGHGRLFVPDDPRT